MQLPYHYLEIEDYAKLKDEDFWLTDRLISFASLMLRKQYPSVGGLLDTTRAKCKGRSRFMYIPGEVIQIMCVNDNHWVVAARLKGQIVIYDSLAIVHHPLDSAILSQLKSLFIPSEEHQMFDQFSVVMGEIATRQIGSSDCGLFAIAIAHLLCRGESPEHKYLLQNLMRHHLFKCVFEIGEILPFPCAASGKIQA